MELILHAIFGFGYPTPKGPTEIMTRGCRYCKKRIVQDLHGNWYHIK